MGNNRQSVRDYLEASDLFAAKHCKRVLALLRPKEIEHLKPVLLGETVRVQPLSIEPGKRVRRKV